MESVRAISFTVRRATDTCGWSSMMCGIGESIPNLIERLGDDTYLIIAGEVALRPTASGLSGTLDGYFRITRNAFAGFSAAEACVSSTHGFTLSK
jgi:hypothetical protein